MWCRSSTRNSRTVSKRLTNYYAQELSIYALMIREVINDVMSNDAIVSSPQLGLWYCSIKIMIRKKVHGCPMGLSRLIGGDGEVRSLHLAILEAMHVKGDSYYSLCK